jgi:Mrp family chromosome partitioning ATPase/capsular polysaccharide biosynthesis protein
MLSMPMTGYLGMDLPRFLALVRARARLIAAIVGGAFLLALGVSLLQPSRYEASADLLFGRTSNADIIVAEGRVDTGEVPERAAATNIALAELDTVAVRVKRQLRESASADELKDAVTVEARGDSDLGTVTAEWDTPKGAAAVANAFAAQIVAVRRDAAQADIQRAIDALAATRATQEAQLPERAPETRAMRALTDKISELETLKALETGGVQVVEEATPPQNRSAPKPLRNALIAAFVALALALFLVLLLARFDERIGDENELAAIMDAPVLARIPHVRARRLLPSRTAHDNPAFLEAFEFLRLNLQLMEPERGSFVIAVTSPGPGDGKTTVVGWLARSLAVAGGDVVAVDLDVRKPELHEYVNAVDQSDNGQPAARDEGAPANEQPDRARRVYTAEDITAGLSELAYVGGNARRAARTLKAAGRDIPESTLRRWKAQHAPLYAELGAARGVQDGAPTTDDLTQPTLHPHIRLLTARDHPALTIGRERLQQLFARLHDNADYVLVDTVPVSTVADASAVAAAAYGVVVVVDLERTRRRDLLAAKKQLDNARADVLGIVLNRAAVEQLSYVYRDLDDPLADQQSE